MTHEIRDVFGNLAHKGLARGVIIRLTEKSVVVEDRSVEHRKTWRTKS